MEDLTGRTIGGYQIIEKIGRGGMATVFRAYQPSLDRDVAIKVLPPYYAEQDKSFLQRFKREAKAIAKLRHPNILMVMDFGEQDELAYLVMEYVTAGTLKERMKRPIRLREIYNLVDQVGSALQYAHDQGVVHRDIKPSNIMLPKPDWALLTDFGLATMVGGSFLTQSGMTVGTPSYMSPEQGSGERVDHRTDIYALGIMLYEMVVGEVPYTAETPMAVVVKHIVDPLPIPREKNPDIPEDLQRVILKSLAKKAEDRYQRASDLTDALQAVANSHPDWSATEIRTVTAVRTPQVDQPETKRLEDEEPAAEQADAPTMPPLEDDVQTQVEEAPESAPAESDSEPVEPPPPLEMQIKTQVVEEVHGEEFSEREAGSLEEPLEPAPKADASEESVLEAPAPKKRPRWLVIGGGIAVFLVCAFLGLAVLSNIFGEDTPQNAADQPASGVVETLPEGATAEDEGELAGEEEFEQIKELLRRGEFEPARERIVDFLRRRPEMWEPFMGLVGMQVEAGQLERAARLLETGLEAHPDAPPENYAGLGWLYLELNRPAQALQAFFATVQRYPGYLEAHEGLIHTALEAGRVGEALGFLEELQRQFPEEALIYRSQAELFRAEGNLEAAVGAVNAALELNPENPKILVTAYNVFIDAGDIDAAREVIDQALEIAPEDPAVLNQAGWAYLEFEQPERAVEYFEKALSMEDPTGWNTLGLARALISLDREPRRVQDLLRRTEEAGVENQDIWMLTVLGWTFREMEDCDNAVRIFEMIQEIDPGNENAVEGINSCR